MKPTTKPQTTPTRCIFYARVSSDSQVENTSIEDQLSRGKAFAVSQGWNLDRIFMGIPSSPKQPLRCEDRAVAFQSPTFGIWDLFSSR